MARVGKNKKDLAREQNASLDEKFEFMAEIFEEFKTEYEQYRSIPANTKDVNLLRQKHQLEKDFVEVYQPMLLEVMTGKELSDQIDKRNVDKNAYFMYKWGSIIMDEYDRKKDMSLTEKTEFREEFNRKYKPFMERELLAKEEQPRKEEEQEMERVTKIMANTREVQEPENVFKRAGNAVRNALNNFWNTLRGKPKMLSPGQVPVQKDGIDAKNRKVAKKEKTREFFEKNKTMIYEKAKGKVDKLNDFKKVHGKKVAYTLAAIGVTAMTFHSAYTKDINPQYQSQQPKNEPHRMEENIQFQYQGNPHMAPTEKGKKVSFRESMKTLVENQENAKQNLEIGDPINTKQGVRGTANALGEGDYRICDENEQYIIGGIAAVNEQTKEIVATQPGEAIKTYDELLENRGIENKDQYKEVFRLQDKEGNDIMWLNKEDTKESDKQVELNIINGQQHSITAPSNDIERGEE